MGTARGANRGFPCARRCAPPRRGRDRFLLTTVGRRARQRPAVAIRGTTGIAASHVVVRVHHVSHDARDNAVGRLCRRVCKPGVDQMEPGGGGCPAVEWRGSPIGDLTRRRVAAEAERAGHQPSNARRHSRRRVAAVCIRGGSAPWAERLRTWTDGFGARPRASRACDDQRFVPQTADGAVGLPVCAAYAPRIPMPEFRTLDAVELEALLARNHVGRLAYRLHDEVNIEPSHSVYADGVLYVRTSAGHILALLEHRGWVAFEVDEVQGLFDWRSVVVHGSVAVPHPPGPQDRTRGDGVSARR